MLPVSASLESLHRLCEDHHVWLESVKSVTKLIN